MDQCMCCVASFIAECLASVAFIDFSMLTAPFNLRIALNAPCRLQLLLI